MAITINDNFQNNSPKSLDNKYLLNGTTVYTNTAAAVAAIPGAYRFRGCTVLVSLSGTATEYWWRDGVADGDLIVKQNAGVPTSRLINTLPTISGGGSLAADLTLAVVDNTSIQKVQARKNSSGSPVGARPTFNFIEGTNVTMTVADDSINDEIDITINASSGSEGITPNFHLASIVAESTTFTYAGIIGAVTIPPFIFVYPLVLVLQTTDATPSPGEVYVDTTTGEFIGGTAFATDQKVGITWYT